MIGGEMRVGKMIAGEMRLNPLVIIEDSCNVNAENETILHS